MEFSSIDQSRFAKYSIIIRKKNGREVTGSELDCLAIDEQRTEQFVADYRNIKVSELLKLVGDDERFQKTMLMLLCLFNFAYAFIAFMIPYVFYEPTFLCIDEVGTRRHCSQAEACANPRGFEVQSAITSLVTEHRLYCGRRGLLEVCEAAFVISGGFVAFVFGVLSDKIGRKKVFIISYFLTITGTLVAMLVPSLGVIIFANVLSWSGMDTFFSMVYIYCNEIIGSGLRSRANGYLFLSWGMGEIMVNVINIWITDYRFNFLLQFAPIFLLGAAYFYLQESPYLLYKLKRISELYSVLRFIGIQNGRPKEQLETDLRQRLAISKVVAQDMDNLDSFRLQRLTPVVSNKVTGYWRYFGKFCKDQSVVMRLIGVTLIAGNIYIGYSLSILVPQRMGLKNVYINGIFLGFSEILGYFFIIPIANIVKRRHLNFLCNAAIVAFDLLLLALDMTAEDWNPKTLHWAQTLVSCLVKLAFCINYAMIFNYCSELFPTKIRGLTLGICIFFGRLMIVFAFYVQRLTDHFQIHPMIGTIFGSIVVMPISLFMPETLNTGISN